jgi:hypothetical protein
VPRDPGNSTVADLAIGFAFADEESTMGLQFHYQPGRSHTWADTPSPLTAADGTIIPAGGKTIENWFEYANMAIAGGFTKGTGFGAIQLGLDLFLHDFDLEQEHYLQATRRDGHESWTEWSPSWGLIFEVGDAEVRYAGRFRAKGFPDFGFEDRTEVAMPGGPDIVIAPTQPVFLPDYHTFTNQIAFVLPIGGRRTAAARR